MSTKKNLDSLEKFWSVKAAQRTDFYNQMEKLTPDEAQKRVSFFRGKLKGVRFIEPNGQIFSAEDLKLIDGKR
jgi:hypothetical protein